MYKRVKILLLSLVITLVVILGGYLLYASFWEGGPESETVILDKDDSDVSQSAQKLLIGDYVVYATSEPTPDKRVNIKLWRYLIGGQGAEEIITFLTDSEDIEFFKFSEQSLAIWYDNNKELWHINGDMIGPAESNRSLISPDRRWLIITNLDNEEPVVTLQSIATGAQKDWAIGNYIESGYLLAHTWSDNSRLVYLTAKDNLGDGLPGLWVLDLSREQIIEFAEVSTNDIFNITVYPDLKKAIGISDGLPSRVMLIDLVTGVTAELISNSDYKFTAPRLSIDGRSFSYTLLGPTDSVWLADFINPQLKQEEMVAEGRLLAWLQDDIWLVEDDNSLQVYNKALNQIISLVSVDEIITAWEFIDIFNIE